MTSLETTQPLIGTFYRYHFIGNGAQFRVYAVHSVSDKPTGRVIKVPLDFNETKYVITPPLSRIAHYDTAQEFNSLANERAREVMQFKHTLPRLLEGAYGRDTRFMANLGHLKMLQAPIPTQAIPGAYFLPLFYTQDQVTTIGGYLEHFRFAEKTLTNEVTTKDIAIIEKLIQKIIDLHYTIWEYGFFEFVFKPENMGVHQNGNDINIIWMDLAEHITDKAQAEKILLEKRWHHPILPQKIDYIYLPTILQEHYIKACDEAFTLAEFRRRWRRKCDALEAKYRRKLHAQALLMRDERKIVANWIAQQNLHNTIYQGLKPEQIDSMNIPQSDLVLLYNDRRSILTVQQSDILEPVERNLAMTSEQKVAYEQLLFKHIT